MATKSSSPVKNILTRYFVDATGSMAYGLFATLIIGTIIGQLAQIGPLAKFEALGQIAAILKKSEVFGAAIGAAIAHGLKADPLVMLSSAGAGAIGCSLGGPVGAYLAAIIGAELGQLVSKKTPVDIVVTPLVTIVSGGVIAALVGPSLNAFMQSLGNFVNSATVLMPLLMGIVVGTVVGMILTLPISSAALCLAISIDGLAAGAAVAGCCAQMIGFAVISYRDNGVSGLISQGIGTSMLQVPNIMRRPQIWIAPTLASAVCGALSTTVFKMSSNSVGAGMGTSGLVGQIATYGVMAPEVGSGAALLSIVALHIVIPALVALFFHTIMVKLSWVKPGDMKLKSL